MEYNKGNRNRTTIHSKICNHIMRMYPLCITQRQKLLTRSNTQNSLAKQDQTPRRARARNGYKRRPPEPYASFIRITFYNRLRKAINNKGEFEGTILIIHQTSFKDHSRVKFGIKSEIYTSDSDRVWVSQYRQFILENWNIFSRNSKFPIKAYHPILEGIDILNQNINIHSKPNSKQKIGKLTGKIIPPNNSSKRRTTQQNHGLIHTTQLHSLVKGIKSIHSYHRLKQTNVAFTNKRRKSTTLRYN